MKGKVMDLKKFYAYDIETYKDLFSFSVVRADGKFKSTFQCSKFKNEIDRIFACLDYLKKNEYYLVGFNSNQFDYPVLHEILKKRDRLPKSGISIANKVFDLAQKQIESFRGEGFGNTIKYEDQYVKQVDLFKVHHFDNRAKMTSLKMIEFNLRMSNLKDLPYEIESTLTEEMVAEILQYNEHDVEATRLFFIESLSQVQFRLDLTEKYGKSFLNHNDGKIGKDYFQMELENRKVKLREFKNGREVVKQTKRDKIVIGDCLFDYYDFIRPECNAIKDWFSKQVITETKGVFSNIEEHLLFGVAKYAELTVKRKKFKGKPSNIELSVFKEEHPLGWIEEEELKATEYAFDSEGNHIMEYPLDEDNSPDLTKKMKKKRIPKKSYWGCWKVAETLNILLDGLRVDFGVGGIHASLSEKVVKQTKKYIIRDADVSSMYPNIAISNNIYPEHLGEGFCEIYQDVYNQRKSYAKGTPENAMLKLALNCVYGDSNNKFSVFFDPMYTMKITINGQLSLLMLAEKLLEIEGLKLIQLNTDGLTVALPIDKEAQYFKECKNWEKIVGLDLEYADYSKMFIRDVNNYIALYTNGKVKRKGAYQFEDLGWHQNQSSLVVPMAANAKMLEGKDIREFIEQRFSSGNTFDFMLRTKVDRSSRLVLIDSEGKDIDQQRICRYYPSKHGYKMVKIMKPLEGNIEERRLSIESAWLVKTCNHMKDFDGDIDFDYYVAESEKLVIQDQTLK